MRALATFDKFRGSMSAAQACRVAADAVRECGFSAAQLPLSDGGEGFAAILTGASLGTAVAAEVTAPHGGKATATFGMVKASALTGPARDLFPNLPAEGWVAVLEMASASGLALIPADERDPWAVSSFGTGELLLAAARAGADAIVLGIGGSGTADLGCGALAALGVEFVRKDGSRIENPVPGVWPEAVRIAGSVAPLPPILVAADVESPLCGPCGAAALFAPQKGLPVAEVPTLDTALVRMSGLLSGHFGAADAVAKRRFSGAAGGIGLALELASCARIVPGFDVFSAWTDLDRKIAGAELVLTGEGSLDAGSLSGKGPVRIAREAAAAGKRVLYLAGRVEEAAARILTAESPLVTVAAVTPPGMEQAAAFAAAPELLRNALKKNLASYRTA
jgi:glycerate kinase